MFEVEICTVRTRLRCVTTIQERHSKTKETLAISNLNECGWETGRKEWRDATRWRQNTGRRKREQGDWCCDELQRANFMADRGFKVKDDLTLCGAHLALPAFTRRKSHLSGEDGSSMHSCWASYWSSAEEVRVSPQHPSYLSTCSSVLWTVIKQTAP